MRESDTFEALDIKHEIECLLNNYQKLMDKNVLWHNGENSLGVLQGRLAECKADRGLNRHIV